MILEIKNLSFSYNKSIILDNINFKLESPITCSILGPNGIGKTTLIKCLLNINKDFSGQILFNEKDIKKIDRKELYEKVSYVKQGGKENSIYTVSDTVLLGLASRINPLLIPSEDDMDKVEKVLYELNILDLKDKYVSQLSGGEAQMVFIARALVKDPQILIFDEPESNLDYRNQLLVLDIINKLESLGKIIIFNTHYFTHALRYSKKSLLLSSMNKYIFGDTKEILTKENIEETFKIKVATGEIIEDNTIYKDIIPLSII